MEVCCLGLFTCWIHPFATSRERAGVMACLPSAAMLGAAVLVNVLMSVVNLVQFQIPYQTCLGGNSQYIKDPCVKQNLFGWQTDKNCNPCYPEYSAMVGAQNLSYCVSAVVMIYLCIVLGSNRSKLQIALGMPDAGIVNFLIYAPVISACIGSCAICQEARAVKHRWIANGQQPLVVSAGVQVPMQPVAAYTQAPG